jgi:tetratricopeptide (TPR) repeat protein
VSSPGDVAPERGRVEAVVAKLNREFEGLARMEPVLWEGRYYKADSTFQTQIPEAVACDIVLSMFWTRLGTALPPDFPPMPDGRPYPSGTAYELLTALAASRQRGVPDIYVFRKTADATLPTTDAERRRQAQTQLDALEAFWSEWFKSERGEFKAAFHNFASTDAFEHELEALLRQWLERKGVLGPRLAWPQEKGSPFRGLAPFEAEHAAVFFGRDRVIDEARRRLVAAAEAGTPFLLVVGASGAGKSSLARAGVIPRLTTPGVVASVELWRVALMKPSEGGAGPLLALAAALFAAGALPELAQGDYPDAPALADNLARGGEASVRPVLRALARVAEAAQRERHGDQPLKPALVLLLDQLEELFAQGVSDKERAAFIGSVRELVATGQVWCIATLRADLYQLLLDEPVLNALKEAGASLDLGPPSAAELAQIVWAPAAAAGLTFESDAAKGELDERLLADVESASNRGADSLPLLQFTLRQLYERRSPDGRLTHESYDTLGGLRGAIAAEAEHAVAPLATASLEALPRLLRHLAEPARDGTTLTLREARLDGATYAPETALVDALLGARILIARRDAAGRPTIRLAHDAVLASWPRAAEAARASRDFYRVRAEVEDALQRWQADRRPKDRLIPSGVPLAEAERLVDDFGAELPAELTAYVRASRQRARVRQQLVAAAAVFFLALAIAATGAGVMAYRAQQQAVAERNKATRNFELAKDAADSLVFDIAQGLRNVEGMRAEAVRKILETAKATFEQLAAAAPDDLELQRSRSVMLNEFGNTYITLGDLEQALRSFRDGLAIAERLAKADPNNADWQRDLSVFYNKIGDVLVDQGNLAEALQSFRDGLAIRERLAKADPNNASWQRDLSVSNERVGDVYLAQGNLAAALEQYRASLDRMVPLRERDPSNADLQRFTTVTLNKVGDVLVDQGNLAEALRSFRDGLAIAERLVKADPNNSGWQRDLSISYNKIGGVLVAQGNLPEALQSFRDSLAIRERLAKADPDNAGWQRDLTVSYDRVGDVLVVQGNLAEALQSFRDGLTIAERLAKADPNNAGWQRDLSVSYNKIGDVLVAQSNLPEALTSFRDGLAIAERLAKADPNNAGWQRDLAFSHGRLASVYRKLGNVAEALAELRKGRDIMAALVAIAPDHAQWRNDLAWFDGQIAEVKGAAQAPGRN